MPAKGKRVDLTKTMIDAAQAGEGGRRVYLWDAKCPGLGVRVGERSKVFIVTWRTKAGEQRREVIDAYGAITLDAARVAARKKLGEVASGRDPLEEKRKAKAATTKRPTFENVAERYVGEHLPLLKEKSRYECERLLRRDVLPALGEVKIGDVTYDHVAALQLELAEKPYRANRALEVASKVLGLAELWGYRPPASNPCRRLKPFKEHERHHVLSELELRRLVRELRRAETADPSETEPVTIRWGRKGKTKEYHRRLPIRLHGPAVACLKLIMLTGLRREEAARLTWDVVDLEGGCLRLGDSKTGPRDVVLSDAAVKLLEKQTKTPGVPWVFTGIKTSGNPPRVEHVKALLKAWETIRRRARLEGVRIHDLRHTVGAHANAAGLSSIGIGQVLGDRDPRSAARYGRMDVADLRNAANEATARIAAALAKGAKR